MEPNKFIPSTFQSYKNITLEHKEKQDRGIAVVVVILFMIAVLYGSFYTSSYKDTDQEIDLLVYSSNNDNKVSSSSYGSSVIEPEQVYQYASSEENEVALTKPSKIDNIEDGFSIKVPKKKQTKQKDKNQSLVDSTAVEHIYIEDPDQMNSINIPSSDNYLPVKYVYENLDREKESMVSLESKQDINQDTLISSTDLETENKQILQQNKLVKKVIQQSVVVDRLPQYSIIIGAFNNKYNFNKRKALALQKGYSIHTKVTSKGLYLLAIPTTSDKQDQKLLKKKVDREFNITSWVKVSS